MQLFDTGASWLQHVPIYLKTNPWNNKNSKFEKEWQKEFEETIEYQSLFLIHEINFDKIEVKVLGETNFINIGHVSDRFSPKLQDFIKNTYKHPDTHILFGIYYPTKEYKRGKLEFLGLIDHIKTEETKLVEYYYNQIEQLENLDGTVDNRQIL